MRELLRRCGVRNEPQFDIATGGAPSVLFAAPPWQRSVSPYQTRGVPDVSYDAAVDGGVYTIHTIENPADPDVGKTFIFLTAGTSSGSPQWAAMLALADQARPIAGEGPIGFAAGPGWDAASGLGTPNVANLIPALVAAPAASTLRLALRRRFTRAAPPGS